MKTESKKAEIKRLKKWRDGNSDERYIAALTRIISKLEAAK
jgi:hypothetical protein